MLGNSSPCKVKGGKEKIKKRKEKKNNGQYLERNFKMKLPGGITMKFLNFLIDEPGRENFFKKMGEIIKK